MDYSLKENEPSYMMEYIIHVVKLEENKRRTPPTRVRESVSRPSSEF
jgi:hypothetical protein